MSDNRPTMDKTARKGIQPGPGSGVVKSYNAKRNPFGGYITDNTTGLDLFVHKSAVQEAGLDKLVSGQKVNFIVVEDGVGGFKASSLSVEE